MAKHRDIDKWTEREEQRLAQIALREASRAKQEKNDQRRLKQSLRDRFLILGETVHNAFPPDTPTKVILSAIHAMAWNTSSPAPSRKNGTRSLTTPIEKSEPILDQVEA
jgi:hypothetical protein